MKLNGKKLREVSFPVGGIGAGCVGLAGNGRLIDWEIFNKPSKNSTNGPSHFAVRAERAGRVLDARVLNGDLETALSGSFRETIFREFGFGALQETMCGFPHFRSVRFRGEFPVAELTFQDSAFPGGAKLRAWSPFVPGDSDTASLPCAVFEIEIRNTTNETTDYYCGGSLGNPWKNEGSENIVLRSGGRTHLVCRNHLPEQDFNHGEIALSTDAADVSYQQYYYRGCGMDRYDVYWKDWTAPGPLKNRAYPPRSGMISFADTGLVAGHLRLAPGETGTVRFILSWYIPFCKSTISSEENIKMEMDRSGIAENRWKNYYTKLCSGADEAARKLFESFDSVRRNVFLFRDAIHRSTIPAAALEGAAETLSVLVSPTCLRLEDGTFWGWEGVGTQAGSCFGTCQHVWNYAQALPFLFPDLERTIRESQKKYDLDSNGAWHFRLFLPLGIKAQTDWFRPCVDGSFGEVMKIFREWKISGDTEWMKSMYPAVKQAVAWAWSPKNPDRWDPEKTGYITGRQHNTLDIEIFGPSGWMNSHYLGALKAAFLMADVAGDADFAAECRSIFEKGVRATEEHLFNGEYYIQKIDLSDKSIPESYANPEGTTSADFYWDSEHNEIKYQFGEGCEIDSVLAQWYASLYGIGRILDPAHVRSTMNAVYRYNFRENMRSFVNTWRVFSKDDESGLVMCAWPAGAVRPVIPIMYHSETMTGFEWAAAAHLVMLGEVEKGVRVAQGIRGRYDGEKRNPWNEIECGSNYARAMAAYGMIPAFSGFTFDMTEGRIGFKPVVPGDFRCFWSLGTVWGEFVRRKGTCEIRILHGAATFQKFGVAGARVFKNKKILASVRKDDLHILAEACPAKAGDVFSFIEA